MTTTQTRDPLPEGVTTLAAGDGCRTCGATDVVFTGDGWRSPYTRSVAPDANGMYTIQSHYEWCPVWTGEQPRLACRYPDCGAPVDKWDFRPGFWLVVPGAGPSDAGRFGGDGHIEATPENERRYPGAERERASYLDKVTVKPCGHTLEGDEAHAMLTRIADVRREDAQRKADATIAQHADVLDQATAAGYGQLADRYRQAVQQEAVGRGKKEAAGLLVALRTLTEEHR